MLTVILRVEAYKLVSLRRFQVNAVRPVVSKEVRVLTIATVAEAGVGADLPVWLCKAHGVGLKVENVALATLIVAQSTGPGLELFFTKRFFAVILGLWA